MSTLIVTQAVDSRDPVLGFFVRWLEEIAKRTDSLEVVCLREGAHRLPGNVRVHALRQGARVPSPLRTAVRFLALAWKLRRNYRTIFVHMNPEYVIVAGPLWRLLGKRIMLWYNHPYGEWKLRMAAHFCHTLFYTSPHAASARFQHALRMPAGIDTNLFMPAPVPRDRRALYLQGRVAPSKRIHVALSALRILRERVPATLTTVGPEDERYAESLRERFRDLIHAGAVTFAGPKAHEETPALYASHGVAINLAGSGHFDKTVLEAMACETPVVIGSSGFEGLVPAEWAVPKDDAESLANALERLIGMPEGRYRVLAAKERAAVVESQSLSELADRLAAELS